MTRMKCFDGLNRGPWQPDEDRLLKAYIEANGVGRWSTLPTKAGLKRCGKSCRLRWMNYLRPDVKRGHISADEEDLIIRLHKLVGNRWSLIAARVPGRTDNDIKNFWNIHLSKKLGCKGIHLPPKSKAKNAASSNDNGRGDSTTGKMHSISSADKNVERHNLNVQTDSIAGRTESKPLEHPCNLNTAFNTRSLCASTSTTVQVDQQNSDGIVSDSIQGLTSCDQYHADRMPDSFWFGSLPWLDSNGGDNFCCNYSTTFFNDAQPNSLISEFDMRDLW